MTTPLCSSKKQYQENASFHNTIRKDDSISEKIGNLFSASQINSGFNFAIGSSLGSGLVGGTIAVTKLVVESIAASSDQTKYCIFAVSTTIVILGGIFLNKGFSTINENTQKSEK